MSFCHLERPGSIYWTQGIPWPNEKLSINYFFQYHCFRPKCTKITASWKFGEISISVVWATLCGRWKEGETLKQRSAQGQGSSGPPCRVCKVTLRPPCKVTLRPAGLTDGLHRFHQMYFSTLRCASFPAMEQDTGEKLVLPVSDVTWLVQLFFIFYED